MVTIATVAGRTGISAYNLRFYEKEGLISVPRTKAEFVILMKQQNQELMPFAIIAVPD